MGHKKLSTFSQTHKLYTGEGGGSNNTCMLFIQNKMLKFQAFCQFLKLVSYPKRKLNDCVVCEEILHELGAKQYHMRLKVMWCSWAPEWNINHKHLVFFLYHGFIHFWPLNIINRSFGNIFTSTLWSKKHTDGQKAYHMTMWYALTLHSHRIKW